MWNLFQTEKGEKYIFLRNKHSKCINIYLIEIFVPVYKTARMQCLLLTLCSNGEPINRLSLVLYHDLNFKFDLKRNWAITHV